MKISVGGTLDNLSSTLSGAILLAFGIQKAIYLAFSQWDLGRLDPVLAIDKIWLQLFFSPIEIVSGLLIILFAKHSWTSYLMTAIGGGFVLYRITYSASGSDETCACLAFTHDLTKFQQYYMNSSLTTIAYFILIVGCYRTLLKIRA